MKAFLKGFLRFLVTLNGLNGVFVMAHALFQAVGFFEEPKHGFDVFLGVFQCAAEELVGGYFIYVAFVVWQGFSLKAVKHVSILLALGLFAVVSAFVSLPEEAPSPKVFAFYILVFVSLILVSYFAFRLCRFALRRALFPGEQSY